MYFDGSLQCVSVPHGFAPRVKAIGSAGETFDALVIAVTALTDTVDMVTVLVPRGFEVEVVRIPRPPSTQPPALMLACRKEFPDLCASLGG